MVQTIKSLIAPLIMMAGLALLPACWGLKRPSPVTSTISELCTTNPFQGSCNEDYEIERIVKITECIAGGAAATPTCADAVGANSCIRDPFVTACATDDNFAPYLARARNARVIYCATDNADVTLCASVAGSVMLDNECLDSPVDAPANASCPTRPSVVRICADDPFTRPGCGNVSTIDALRIAHCEDPLTAWDDGCVEATYVGAVVARNTACLEYGIDAEAGGHADCAERGNVLAACGDNTLFAHDVCDAVEGNGVKQINACLANVDADDGCEALIMQTCEDTPLAGVGCAWLDGHSGFLDAFCAKDDNAMMVGCEMTPAGLCFADPFGDMVTDGDGTIDCLADDAYDSARQVRCRAGTEGSGECDTAEIAPKVCASSGANANPFATFCMGASNIGGGDYAAIRQTVLTNCLDGMSNDDGDVCQNTVVARATLAMDCVLAEAFKPRCNYTEYRPARESFCTTQSTAWNALCDGETISGTENARNLACINDSQGDADMGNDGGDTKCPLRPVVMTACDDRNPFRHPVCNNIVGINEGDRTTYCQDPATAWHDRCTQDTHGEVDTARGRACVMFGIDESAGGDASCTTNYADWNGSFTGGDVLATAPVSTHTTNQFLSGLTAGELSVTGFTPLTTMVRDGQTANATPDLALNDPAHGFGGQAEDGVKFFGGQLPDDSYRYYAGIYTTTDVGLPLTDASQSGVWRAWMRTSGKDPKNEYFELTVAFNTSPTESTLRAFFPSTSGTNTLYYKIDGMFGPNGVITGTVAIGTEDSDNNGSLETEDNDYTKGVLTGLIGVEGVVAAFVSNTSTITADGNGDGINPFVGGFVGIPALADHAAFSHHYKTQLNTDLTTGEVAFAEGSAVGLVNTGLTFDSSDGEFDTFAVRFNDASVGDDGFALLFGQTDDASANNRYRAGLLSGTDLGAPLVDGTTDGDWTGKVYVSSHVNSTTNVPMDVSLTLAVDFSAGTIRTASAVTTAVGETIEIDGLFRAGSNNPTLPVGILGGTVTYDVSGTEHAPLPLIGLIGVDGAIGVFHGGSAIPMVGGFWVTP